MREQTRLPEGRLRWSRGVLLAAAAACAPAPAGATCLPDHPHGEAGDRLRVGFVPGPPLVVTGASDGKPHGFAIDVLRALAGREGWQLDLVEVSAATLPARVGACELDVGVAGVPVSAAQARSVDYSLPYLATVTTAIVHGDDESRAGAWAEPRPGRRLAAAVARAAVGALVAVVSLALAAWVFNVSSRVVERRLRWRRTDAAVAGPWTGLRWLWRSGAGRGLLVVWLVTGGLSGAAGPPGDVARPLSLGQDPVRALVEAAAHTDQIFAERIPDREQVPCAAGAAQACFRGFADRTMAAVAGPREILCAAAEDLAMDGVSLREDVAVPEQFAFLLPPGSPLRVRLNAALLRWAEEQGVRPQVTRCPGDGG